MAMAAVRTALVAAFMVTVVLCKPVSYDEDSSKSSESFEANSSEESATHVEPAQEASQEPAPEQEPAPDPVSEPAPEPAPGPEPGPDPALELAPEPALEPAQEPVPEPALEPAQEPVPETVPEPAPEPAPELVQEPCPEQALEPALEPASEPTAMMETDPQSPAAPLPCADTGPSPAPLDTPALPDPEHSQTPIDPLSLMPDDPSQSAPLGVDISQDMPNTDPKQQHPVNAADTGVHALPDAEVPVQTGCTQTDVIGGVDVTNQPQVISTNQGSPQGAATTPPAPPELYTTPPMPIPIRRTLNGMPVCFTFQFVNPEPNPPRGDQY